MCMFRRVGYRKGPRRRGVERRYRREEKRAGMLKRFEGDDGSRLLKESVKRQKIVGGDDALAEELISVAKVTERKSGDILIRQSDSTNSLFLILAGRVTVMVNGRGVATRQADEHVGEMALIDPSAPRSATVTVVDDAVVAEIEENQFSRIIGDHPVWRRLSRELCQRLRARGEMLRQPNDKPRLFLGSSVEALPVIKAIQAGLAYENVVPVCWGDGVFSASASTLEALEAQIQAADFSLMAFTPDDVTKSRQKQTNAPRDNVVFELGLFMGALGRKRTFIVQERGAKLKIPSDLLGLTTLPYAPGKTEDLRARMAPVCTALAEIMHRLGVR